MACAEVAVLTMWVTVAERGAAGTMLACSRVAAGALEPTAAEANASVALVPDTAFA